MAKITLKYTLWTVVFLMTSIVTAAARDTGKVTEGGRKQFVNYGCYECHGYQGQGGFSGPRIIPTPYHLKTFMGLVRKPTGAMPAFSPRVLPDRDLKKIYAYVISIPKPTPLRDIPDLAKRTLPQ